MSIPAASSRCVWREDSSAAHSSSCSILADGGLSNHKIQEKSSCRRETGRERSEGGGGGRGEECGRQREGQRK